MSNREDLEAERATLLERHALLVERQQITDRLASIEAQSTEEAPEEDPVSLPRRQRRLRPLNTARRNQSRKKGGRVTPRGSVPIAERPKPKRHHPIKVDLSSLPVEFGDTKHHVRKCACGSMNIGPDEAKVDRLLVDHLRAERGLPPLPESPETADLEAERAEVLRQLEELG